MNHLKSILLIEDDPDDQEFFIEAISHIQNTSQYAVVNNGREALERLNTSMVLPDLIFSDIEMPLMNGIYCFTEIKKAPRIRNIPLVFLSSSTAIKSMKCFRVASTLPETGTKQLSSAA